jgi:hypothetical protein
MNSEAVHGRAVIPAQAGIQFNRVPMNSEAVHGRAVIPAPAGDSRWSKAGIQFNAARINSEAVHGRAVVANFLARMKGAAANA